jgi:hypothetical protein
MPERSAHSLAGLGVHGLRRNSWGLLSLDESSGGGSMPAALCASMNSPRLNSARVASKRLDLVSIQHKSTRFYSTRSSQGTLKRLHG